MKKTVIQVLLFLVYTTVFGQSYGGYNFDLLPNGPLKYEKNSPYTLQWSLVGSGPTHNTGESLQIESSSGIVAVFSNGQTETSINRNSPSDKLILRGVGTIKLKYKRWNNTENKYVVHELRSIQITTDFSYGMYGANELDVDQSSNEFYIGEIGGTIPDRFKNVVWTSSDESILKINGTTADTRRVYVSPVKIGTVTLSAKIFTNFKEETSVSKVVTIKEYLAIEADKSIICNGEIITAKITKDPSSSTSITWSSPNLILQSGQGTKTATFKPDGSFNGYTSISVKTTNSTKTIGNIWVGTPIVKQGQFAYEIDNRNPITFKIPENNIEGPHNTNYSWEYFSGSTEYTITNSDPASFTIQSTLNSNQTGQIVFKRIVSNSCGVIAEFHTINIKKVDWSKTLKLVKKKKYNNEFYFKIEGFDLFKKEHPNATIVWSEPPKTFISNLGCIGTLEILFENGEAKYTTIMKNGVSSDYWFMTGFNINAYIYNESDLIASFTDYIDQRDHPYLLDYAWLGGSVIEPEKDVYWFTIENLEVLGSKEDGYELDEIIEVYSTPFLLPKYSYIDRNFFEFMAYSFGNEYTPDLGVHKHTVRLGVVAKLRNGKKINIETDPFTVVYYDPNKVTKASVNKEIVQTFSVKVYSLYSTKVLYKEDNIQYFDINNTNLVPGIYVIQKIDSEGKITTEKVYKQKLK